jgi:predicted RNA-binding protein with PUA-like domain
MAFWIVKQEPTKYPFSQLVNDKSTVWDGVRNYQARNYLAAMQLDDPVLYYHSVVEKAIVGIAKVCKTAYPDPQDPKWTVVEIAAVQPMTQPVTLEMIKNTPELAGIGLVRQARLSVMPIEKAAFEKILALGNTYIS